MPDSLHTDVVHLGYQYPGIYFCFRFNSDEKQHDTDTCHSNLCQPEGRCRKNLPLRNLRQLPGDEGVRVVVIDCDFQHSIMKCRKSDIKRYGEELIPYEVWSYEVNDNNAMTSLVEKLHNDPEIDVALMDSPGSLMANGLVPMFVNSDIIVVPFHYDLVTVPSTASFLMFLDRLRKMVGAKMKARLFIVPNQHDLRVGRRSELLLWDNTRETFSNYGYVTAKIPKRADMERFSTIAGLDMALPIAAQVFDKLYSCIFDTLDPLREVELSGIQLTENLYPKSGKKKYHAAATSIALSEDAAEDESEAAEPDDNQLNQ